MIERDPWQPKLWCGMHDRNEPTERTFADTLLPREDETADEDGRTSG